MQDTPPLRDRIAQFEQELQCYESSYRRIDVPEDPSGFDRVERELLEESGGVQERLEKEDEEVNNQPLPQQPQTDTEEEKEPEKD